MSSPNVNSADLYLSFARVFHRPDLNYVNHFEEVLALWEEEIPAATILVNGLRELCRKYPPGDNRLNFFWEHYIPLFETGKVEVPPYASVHLDDEGLVMGKETFCVQTFYESAGYAISAARQELPDHLAVELEFAAVLAQEGQNELLAVFRQKHLLPFLHVILPRIVQSSRPLFADAAKILSMWELN